MYSIIRFNIKHYFYLFFSEDVDFWKNFPHGDGTYNVLRANYRGGANDKTRFQHLVIDHFFQTFMNKMQDVYEKKQNGDPILVITERSLKTNVDIFIRKEVETGNLESIDGDLLAWKSETFHNIILKHFKMEALYVYLKSSPENCLERIQTRGRVEESGIDLQQLSHLHMRHELLYHHLDAENHKVLILNTDHFLLPNQKTVDVDRLIEEILKFAKHNSRYTWT